MKTILTLSLLFAVAALPALGELTQADLDKIRLIVKAEYEPIKADIVSLKTEVAWMRGKLESVDKQIAHSTNLTYGLIALIVAAIAIPQLLVGWRTRRDRALEEQVQKLTQELETLKKRSPIVSP